MARQANNVNKIFIKFWEGINSKVASAISKPSELSACENCRADRIGELIKRQGTARLGNSITATANKAIFYFQNTDETISFYRVSTVGSTTAIYYLNASSEWTALTSLGTGLTATNDFSTVTAEQSLFLVNGANNNLYIKEDGTTVVDSTTNTGHLYGSPKARKINYYKDRLYLGDYTADGVDYKNGLMMSSKPLGIIALVDGDHETPGADDWINVTDTKYIHSTDTIAFYRGGKKIADDVTIKDKKESSIQINAITFDDGDSLESSDEIWVNGTYTGDRVFRWADNPESGTNVKQYDTFKLTGNQNDRIKMLTNIGDIMLIGNNNNIAVWNDYNLQNYDIGIGCVSDNGYVKALGVLFFIHYTGLYATTGSSAPQLLSAKVERYFAGTSKEHLEKACLGRKGQSIFCGLEEVKLYNPDGSEEKTLNNVVLEYDLNTECWYVHTGIKATQFCTFPQSGDADALEFASTETGYHIYTFLTGQLDKGIVEIPFRADTQEITLSSNFENLNYLLEIAVEVNRGNNIECFVSLDGDPFYAIEGVARKGVNVLKVTAKDGNSSEPPRCKKVKLSFRDTSKKLCKIGKVSIKYTQSLEVEIPHSE